MAAKPADSEVLEQLKRDAPALGRELRDFAAAAQVLSSDHPRLIDEYPDQWVAIYEGQVCAHGESLKSVLNQLAEQHIPAEKAIVRFIERAQKTMIL
jgi:hypothetical protein